MRDAEILGQIEALVAEEHELRARSVGRGLDDGSLARLRTVEHDLDRCWDLLRQRRAKAEFGDNPDNATQRSPAEVESYLQ